MNRLHALMRNVLREKWLFGMIAVPFILCLIFSYMPMYGLIIAFKRYDIITGFSGTEWVGLRYFIDFFNDPYFFRIIRNTVVLGTLTLVIGTPLPILFALMLNEMFNKYVRGFVQSVSYFPHFISVVVVVGILFQLFSSGGIVNSMLENVFGSRINFLNSPEWFRPLYISSGLWQSVGFASIVYSAALSNVDTDLYEAVHMDGGGRLRQTWHVTLPGILPTIVIIFILNTAQIIKIGAEKVLLMYNPAIYETSDVIQTYVYRRGIQGIDFSYSTAIGLFDSVIAFLLVVTVNYICKKVKEESLW